MDKYASRYPIALPLDHSGDEAESCPSHRHCAPGNQASWEMVGEKG